MRQTFHFSRYARFLYGRDLQRTPSASAVCAVFGDSRTPKQSNSLSIFAIVVIFFGILAACGRPTPERYPSRDYNIDEVTNIARGILSTLQEKSFKSNREYCGYIGIDPTGQVRAAPASKGRVNLCRAVNQPLDWHIIAHYHTHGAYDSRQNTERPTALDITGGLGQAGLVGFVSTPGGRFWKIGFKGVGEVAATLVCGQGCLPQDPLFQDIHQVESTYTLDDLMDLDDRTSTPKN